MICEQTPTNQEPVIELSGLTKYYGNQRAVDDLYLTVRKGEVFGLLGPNGAGKTTTILMMLGLSEPTSGSAVVCGLDPVRSPLQVKRKVGYMPDDVGFYEDRTALDNLLFTAGLNQIPAGEARERAERLLETVGLAESARKKVGAFSRGMRQRLGLADVLIKKPEVIILDEPTLGIDPEGVRELLALIRSLSREDGITVLLSSHHLYQVQQICDRVGLFVQGRLLACGNIDELAESLNSSGTITVEMTVRNAPDHLTEDLFSIPGVSKVLADGLDSGKSDGSMNIQVICQADVTSSLARAAVQSGAELTAINRRTYGLDDIYHNYFEGSGRDEHTG
ncbi:ABC transporter ATP-binding protein [Paenibacillus tarimensis]|uniref:ABC transporter ATP-binding protein n=1 Tax=Paenibacillus tarimensis TaxID=416012 RepID=UPI001F46392A|nr:ABC transporter ATP-binding protein [Paenibacillus tarimensis]MCF2942460.1 ABC transporter ATP-binding protein [Paenibacillus tarimensis]